MRKRVLCTVLAILLFAAIFPWNNLAYDLPFNDVPKDAWYYNDVKTAVGGGLINGKTADAYCPEDDLTYAEAVKLAACIHRKAMTGTVSFEASDPWYQSYADYAKENRIITADYDWDAAATRADYIAIFAHALPDSGLEAINDVPDGAIPDVGMDHPQAKEIYKLYRAGVLIGSDELCDGIWLRHLCKPADNIQRSEVAAILTRMMAQSARKAFAMSYGNIRYIRTNGYHDGAAYPSSTLISSAEELERYIDENKELYDFAHKDKVYADTTVGFVDAVKDYDAAWFETHQLILILLEEGSGSVRHEVTGVTFGSEPSVDITRLIPEVGTDDMAEWHILIETARVLHPTSPIRVKLYTRNTDGTEAPDLPTGDEKAADFAVRLFQSTYEDKKNTLVSPLSVLGALAMTANGAKGTTQAEMEAVLGMDAGELNTYFRTLLNLLQKESENKNAPLFHLANSIWFTDDENFTVNPAFLGTTADSYDAGVFRVPFNDQTLKDINNWVKEKTNGMIPQILDRIPPDAVMYLVNALAFEGEWPEAYNTYQVRSGDFTREDGTKTTADLMWSRESDYLEDENVTGFIKYYKGGKYAFAALLPKEGRSVSDCVISLDGQKLVRLLSGAQAVPVNAALPKFETKSDFELSEVLAAMGMPTAFDLNQADFTGLGTYTAGNICISRALHKTFISVAEQGTKAGAATVVEMLAGSAAMPNPEQPKQVILDRPFIYMLIDCETNLPFFIGTLADPTK